MIDWSKVRYFKREEFACPCCGEVKIEERLVKYLDEIRGRLGFPLIISSGYRCPEYNKKIGGAPNSAHVLGKAVDIVVSDLKAFSVLVEAVYIFNGIGVNQKGDKSKRFLHLDIADEDDGLPRPTVWSY
jgi:uncharacterized protein YcbK (DUF882 family)